MKRISFKNTVKEFGISVVAIALFLLNSSNVFAVASVSVEVNCSPCNHKEQHICVQTTSATVYGHASGTVVIKENALLEIFTDGNWMSLSEEENPDLPSDVRDTVYVGDGQNLGWGTLYINVPIARDINSHTMHLLVEAPGVTILQIREEELSKVLSSEIICEYTGTKAVVYPNPTSGIATVTLDADYINFCSVQSVRYRLYNSAQKLLATFEPSEVDATVTIPAHFISNNGRYLIKCIVEKESTALTEEFTLQFMVVK